MKQIFATIYLLLISITLLAAPYNGNLVSFKQPDGSTVQVKLYGDEYYIRAESIDGYTLIRDAVSNWICYASLSPNHDQLISTGIHYEGKSISDISQFKTFNLEKHIDISEMERVKQTKQNQLLLNGNSSKAFKQTRGTPVVPVSGNIKGLCIVIDFPDEPAIVPLSEFESFCNDLNYANNGNVGSVRKYYANISCGLLDYENVVFGYYHAPRNFTYYDSLPYAKGAQIILDSALRWIQKQGFDFSTLSVNPDNTIRAINMMYTGNPPNWAQGMWHHKGSFTSFSANGVSTNDYNCSPANDPLQLSVVVHENGHMIGKWPDTYKYNNDNGVDGIGSFDLMCWMGDAGNPVPPNPLFTANAGWKNVIDITSFNGIIYDTANSFTCYKYTNINDTNEFFLIENRMKTGRSTFIEDQGLTIWHINRNGDNQTTQHEVFLEHANNNINDHSKACFRNNYKNEFSANTTPNSNFYSGFPSGLKIWEISNIGNVMNFKVGRGFPSPTLRLMFQKVDNDDNHNQMIEPGETFNLNLKALNIGEVNASNVTVVSEVMKGQDELTPIISRVENLQVNLNDTLPVTLQYKLSSNTKVGSELVFKFTILNDLDTISISQSMIVGNIVLMNNQPETICGAVFYDEGGYNGLYENQQDYVKTFYPENKLKPIVVEFENFDLESSEQCMYDYLEIYNGENIQATLIGKYCGTNNPGKIISTDQSGALTFKFHSDEGMAANGWKAYIKCLYENDYIPEDFINLIPNPGADNCTIRVYNENILSLTVRDVVGNLVLRKQGINAKEWILDMSSQQNGIYFFQIETPSRKVVKKWLLKK